MSGPQSEIEIGGARPMTNGAVGILTRSKNRSDRENQTHLNDFQLVAVLSRRFLEAEPGAEHIAVSDFVAGEAIDIEFLDCKRFDQPIVAHFRKIPRTRARVSFCTSSCAGHNRNRQRLFRYFDAYSVLFQRETVPQIEPYKRGTNCMSLVCQ